MSISELMPIAVGIALNPPAVVAVILMLSSDRAPRSALGFLLGWMGGLLVVGGIVLLMGDVGALLSESSVLALAVQLLVGVALVVAALLKWRAGKSCASQKEMPGWMGSLQGFSAPKAFTTAALFAGLNPKTLALNLAGVLLIVESQTTVAVQVVLLVVFVVLSSLTVGLPVVFYLFARDRSKAALDASQAWLVSNSAAITATVLLVLGVMVASGAAQGLVALW